MNNNIDIYHAAKELLIWANDKHLLASELQTPSQYFPDDSISNPSAFGVFSYSENILKNKQILYVGVNPEASRIYIFTKKSLTKKDIKSIPKYIFDKFHLEYIQAGTAQTVGPNNVILNSPYNLTADGKYTCGSSIHPAKHLGAGTLGCLLKNHVGEIFGLSNNHVTGLCNYSSHGEKILAPGHLDITIGCVDPFTIGHHYLSAPFVPGTPDNVDVSKNTDAAILKIVDPSKISSSQGMAYDSPSKVEHLTSGLAVQKVGRSSGLTTGVVIAEAIGSINVHYAVSNIGNQIAYFEKVFIVRSTNGNPFSIPGDSGSLVVTADGSNIKAVGLVFAGDNQGNSFVLPIKPIVEHFNMEILSGHNI